MIHKSSIKGLIVLAFTLISASSFAQQDPQYTHYMYNMSVVNPAYAGSKEAVSIGFLCDSFAIIML
mgnify:CR=1 FL=1